MKGVLTVGDLPFATVQFRERFPINGVSLEFGGQLANPKYAATSGEEVSRREVNPRDVHTRLYGRATLRHWLRETVPATKLWEGKPIAMR